MLFTCSISELMPDQTVDYWIRQLTRAVFLFVYLIQKKNIPMFSLSHVVSETQSLVLYSNSTIASYMLNVLSFVINIV